MAVVRLMLLVVSLVWGFPSDCASQRYAIIASQTVRPYTNYELVVTNLAKETQQFMCEIVNTNELVVGTSTVVVSPDELRQVEISLQGLEAGKYKLNIWKNQKQSLINTTELEYIDRSYLVLFQTDKPAYKPGDRVWFRVIFLFPNAYPVTKASRPSIFITDPDKHRMKQWINATLTSGVFEGSFQLAEYTMLGLWTISASLNQQHYKESFRVEEYTLPLFKIQVQSIRQPFFDCSDSMMSLKVSASFINGGLVRGNATVIVRANYNNYRSQTTEVAREKLTIHGTAIVQFPTIVVANNCDEERNVWFDVEVTESSTGVSYNTTSLLTIQNNGGATMEVLDGNDGLYPGLAMRLKVLLTSFDETPLIKKDVTILYKVLNADDETSMEKTIAKSQTLQTNCNGIVWMVINTTSTTKLVHVEGIYNNKTFPLVFAYPMYEARNVDYLVIQSRRAYQYIDQNIIVDLYCNVKIKRYYYIGYCSGRVCASGDKKLPNAVENHWFTFIAKQRMKPRIKLLVFAVTEDGTILSSSIVIRVSALGDKSALTIKSTSKRQPNNKQIFKIMAESNAFVGLLGVDERVIQRSTTNNDISNQKLEMAMRSLEHTSGGMWSKYDSFGSVGVTLLTDGYLPNVGPVPHISDEFQRAGKNAAYSTREHFSETWIWESVKTANDSTTIEKLIPDTITTWVVSGFSVGPVHGLQILQKPLTVQTKQTIFVQLYMPPSIKRLEQVTVHCLVHNYGKAANVSLEVRPVLQTTSLFLAEGATENVPVKLQSDIVGTLTVEVILRNEKQKVIDALKQSIPVRPEGLIETVGDVRILDFPIQTFVKKMNLSVSGTEETRYKSYEEVTLSVIGTFLNLDAFDLEQMATSSHGNGEENLLFLQITMGIYDYLQMTNSLQPVTKDKLLSYMEVAYQQLLRYRLDDGSFSMFGSLYECGGAWFTASTAESLRKLSHYMDVEESLLDEALDWLVSESYEDGFFNESCTIAHPHIQRTGGKELSLASSVLFAFIGSDQDERYEQLVNKTLSLLLSANITDVYLMAKTTYLLTLIDHPESQRFLKKLNKEAVKDEDYRYWSVSKGDPTSSEHLRDQETTAYALLANIKQNAINQLEMIKVAQWLQKHSFAGNQYVSSLQRVIALAALGEVASRIPRIVPKMYIQLENFTFEVNSTNQALLQTRTLPSHTRSLSMSVTGSGLVLIKLSYRYSLSNASLSSDISERSVTTVAPIALNVNRTAVQNNTFSLNLCFAVSQPLHTYHSDLWKATIDLPTGYEMKEPQQHYDNTTMSAILLENKSHLELVWNIRRAPKVCYTFTAISRLLYANVVKGLLYLSSFDTKDVQAVARF